jgi:hypothetical protein
MSALENARHERFAQELAKGKSATEAYAAAGYAPNQPSASRLLSNVMVQERVAELKERAAANVSLSREWVLEQLIDNVKQAKEAGDLSPANKALEMLGKELGMFVDRKQIDIDGELRGYSDAALIALLEREGEEGDSEESSPPLAN